MPAIEESRDVDFQGSPEERRLAGELFALMRAQGRFMSTDAPIRVSLDSVRGYFEHVGGAEVAARIDRVLALNASIFVLA
jgi:hypothetical protein